MTAHTLHDKSVLLDCRWLGLGGAGRATEFLLRGLQELEPEGRWVLWGPPGVRRFVWGRARWRRSDDSPKRLWGQQRLLSMPRHDAAVFMHQIRPLRPGPSLTLIHDTIPTRHGGTTVSRTLKKAFLRRAAHLSARIITVSHHSRRCIERDLDVAASKIAVVRYPVDHDMVARVSALRSRLPQSEVGFYVGRFAPHKNLTTLLEAFQATGFRRRGGQLRLAGGSADEVKALRSGLIQQGHESVSVEGPCSQGVLEQAYAASRFLVMPSLEEGFGLPVWEAMACGLPVCVSDGGALPEITRGVATPFPARSVTAMAAAIDLAATRHPEPPAELEAPTLQEFAGTFVEEIRRVVAART